MKTLVEKTQELRETFSIVDTPELFFMTLFFYTPQANNFLPEWKTPENKIAGCQSEAWLRIAENNGTIEICGFGTAKTTAAILGIVEFLYSGVTMNEMKNEDFTIWQEIKLLEGLSFNRANGLSDVIAKIKNFVNSYGPQN